MKTCPECLSQVPDVAEVCSACQRQIVGKRCPDCAEIVKENATRCRYCSHSFAREQRVAGIEPFSVEASLLPTLFLRGRLISQKIHLTPEKVMIQTWGVFGLSRTDEDLPWEKIAGFHYHSGWFWDSVELQTRGQKSNSIGGLPKEQAQRVKEILSRMKE